MKMEMIMQLLSLLLGSTILGTLFTWITTKKQRNNAFIEQLQKSIDLLSDKNEDLMRKVVELREQNIQLLANQEELRADLESMRRLYEKDTGRPAPSRDKRITAFDKHPKKQVKNEASN